MDRHKLQDVVAKNKHFTATRKVSLYSSFARLEETNPDGYEANIAAWKEVLEDAVRSGAFADSTCMEVSQELIADLTDPENGAPLSLYSVIDRMVQDKSIVPLADFKASYPSSASQGLGSRASKVVSWAFGLVRGRKSYIGDGSSDEKFVYMRALREKSATLLDRLAKHAEVQGNNYVSKVFDGAQVQEVAGKDYSALDIECCLAFAAGNRLVGYDRSLNVTKLVDAGPISEVDATISSLRSQISSLARREAALNEQVKDYERKARAAIGDNRKVAKSMLQKKLDAQKSQERTIAALDQLDTILHKIDDAKDNKQAFEALQSSTSVLSELNSSLSVEEVDELVEKLQSTVADTDEVTRSLADLSVGKSSADREMEDLELDDELERLSEAEQSKKAADLPSVPKHKPVADSERPEKQQQRSQRQREPQSAN